MNAKLNTGINLGWFLGIVISILVSCVIWGITVSTQLYSHGESIKNSEKSIDKVEQKIEKVDDSRERDNKETQVKLDKIIQELGIEQGKNER